MRLQPQKKNSVSFTYRRRSTQKYVCCVARQCLFRIHFFASQRLSEGPAYLYNYIYLLLSSFCFNKFFEDLCYSRSRLFTTKYYVTKRKSLQCFDQRISRPSRQFTYILNNFRLSKREERKNKNKPKRRSRVYQKSAEIKLAPFSVGKLPFLHAYFT